MTSDHNITHIVTLHDPGKRPFHHPKFPKHDPNRWLHLTMFDIIDEGVHYAPRQYHAAAILRFGDHLPEDANVLVACEAGISRSTATALTLLVQRYGIDNIELCKKKLNAAREMAFPNPLILSFVDHIMGYDGKLDEAGDQIRNQHLISTMKSERYLGYEVD